MTLKEGKNKKLFILSVFICFITIFIYNYLTPILSDDFSYGAVVKEASSIGDLISQEVTQYNNWTGRSVAHMILRLFLYTGVPVIFDVVSSLVFTGLTLLMYINVNGEKKYNVRLYVLTVLSVWIFGVSFSETILWQTGTCNYLFTMFIILSFITLFRKKINIGIEGISESNVKKVSSKSGSVNSSESTAKVLGSCIVMFLLGLLAGWCNENTSGGAVLYMLILCFFAYRKNNGFKFIKPWIICSFIGILTGFAFMILAPGNMKRAAYQEEMHSGLFGMVSRFSKLTAIIYDEFFVLLIVFVVITVLLINQGKKLKDLSVMLTFFVVFIASCYALLATVTPQPRAMFGAGIFLTMACLKGFEDVLEDETVIKTAKESLVIVLCIYMAFTYIAEGTNMIRIYRELNERDEWLSQYEGQGINEVQAPLLRPGFETKFSIAYDNDITEDEGYWINGMQASYYGVGLITGVPREEWTEY
ncbi:MAG: DUF6056 family protein [Butyrivibrio sp.]|nr:DUF6056 family protein [Butyrivibrio sp.]